MRSRAEHVTWAKRRAYECVTGGDLLGAMRSLASDLAKHPETEVVGSAWYALALRAWMENGGLGPREVLDRINDVTGGVDTP